MSIEMRRYKGETGGRLVSLAIEDWLSGHLVDAFKHWNCSELRTRRLPEAGSTHDFIVVPTQTRTMTRDGCANHVISSMCRYCRYHFIFTITTFPTSPGHQMHHFICEYAGQPIVNPEVSENKYSSLESVAHFRCSCCLAYVEVDVALPRLKGEWLNMLLDECRAREALERAKAEDPDRFLKSTHPERDEILVKNGAKTLNLYLRDILSKKDPAPEAAKKRISFRNKNYMVQFGEPFEPMFEHLGFKKEHNEDKSEWFWIPPRLDPPREVGRTEFGSPRAFYEDVKSEVQSFLEENPPSDVPVVKPLGSARDLLGEALSCKESLSSPGISVSPDEVQHFRALGALPSAQTSDELLMYAFSRQVDVDPEKWEYFWDALLYLAKSRGPDIQEFALKEQHRLTQKSKAKMTSRTQALQMDITEAYGMLSAGPDGAMDAIATNTQFMIDDGLVDGKLAVMALDVISNHRPQNDPGRAEFERTRTRIRLRYNLPDYVALEDETPSNGESAKEPTLSLPAGLTNIRNTCYLNSILQYFYSVKAVRNLVLGLEREPRELDKQKLQAILSRDDSSKLDMGTALAGHEFARELKILFQDLERSTDVAVTPRQRLAEAALLNPDKLRQDWQKAATASTTPAPPSRAPPLPPRAGESADPKVSVESVPEASETASDVSSQTLVNQTDDEPSYVVVDHCMSTSENSSRPASAPADMDMGQTEPRSKDAPDSTINQSKDFFDVVAEALEKSDRVGTDQMDVDEVMGNALDHLRVAFKVEQLEKPGDLPDPIEEAFFSIFIDHRKKVGDSVWKPQTRSERWVAAYPAKDGRRDIYEALGNSFILEAMSGDMRSFTTLDRPAPNFHIFVSRGDENGRKNYNPIEIPDRLYLDRFMQSRHFEQEMLRAKKRAADLNTRIDELSMHMTKETHAQPESRDTSSVQPEDIKEFLSGDSAQDLGGEWTILTPPLKKLLALHDIDSETPKDTAEHAVQHTADAGPDTAIEKSQSDIADFWSRFSRLEAEEKNDLLEQRAKIFVNVKKEVEYRLHAVVCHMGTRTAGHYWVWIHDFEQDVWRKYNDSTVSEHPSDHVFREISTKGEPYCLAYVRAQDISQLVNIPRRQARAQSGAPADTAREPYPLEPFPPPKDVGMADSDERPTTEHLEQAPMSEELRESHPAPAA